MARRTTQLTNTQVKQAKAGEKVYKLSDGGGLQLRVKPNGTKSWLFDYYRPITKKRNLISFGIFPSISLADARELRVNAKKLLAKGIDPKEHREDQQRQKVLEADHTLQNVAQVWFDVKKTKITEKTAISLWRSFENHIFPSIGHRPISMLLAPEVIETLKPLAAKGSLELTCKIIGHINEIMTHAVNTGLLHHNPLAGIKAAFETPKAVNMPTIKPEELPQLMEDISYASIKLITRSLIEWQLHTMIRPGEAAATKWCEIDIENKLWVIPAERMKMKRAHTVPLTDQTIKILNRLKPISAHREYVFPSNTRPTSHANASTVNMALRRMGYKNRLVAHGLRALASTVLNEQGFDSDVIEAALAHVEKNEVRRAYNRAEYLERRRVLMSWWSEHIKEAESGRFQQAKRYLKVIS